MTKTFTILIFSLVPFISSGQQLAKELTLSFGPVFNGSSSEWNSTTGLGLSLEANYFIDENIRLGARFEPTALANGEIVYPGGCQSEHPRYPGINSCAEGANFLLNNYIRGSYFLGSPSEGSKGGRKQAYLGLQTVMLTHQRYIITSRESGNWTDTRQRVTGFGAGVHAGLVLGKFDMNAAYTATGNDFRGFLGINLSYRLLSIPIR